MGISANLFHQAKRAVLHHVLAVSILTIAVIVSPCPAAFGADLGLIDAAALKGNSAKWVILDARPGADWESGHIPGAIQFSWDNYTRTDARGVKFSSFPPQELAVALAELGIDEKTPVVVYGDADKSWGGEGYAAWLLS